MKSVRDTRRRSVVPRTDPWFRFAERPALTFTRPHRLMVLQALRANPELEYDLKKVEELAGKYARARTIFEKWQSSLKRE